jgi:hypothetical protein
VKLRSTNAKAWKEYIDFEKSFEEEAPKRTRRMGKGKKK